MGEGKGHDYLLELRVTDGQYYSLQKDWQITILPSVSRVYDSITLYGLYQVPSRTYLREHSSFQLLIIPSQTGTQSLPTTPVRVV